MKKVKAYKCVACERLWEVKRECKRHEGLCKGMTRLKAQSTEIYWSKELMQGSGLPMTGGKRVEFRKFGPFPSAEVTKAIWDLGEMGEIIQRLKCQGCGAPATPGGKGQCPYCGRRYGS